MFSGHRYLGCTIEMEWQKSISPYILFMLKTTLMYCNVIYLLLNVHNNACQYKENIHWLLQTLCRYKLSSALSNCSINLFILSSLSFIVKLSQAHVQDVGVQVALINQVHPDRLAVDLHRHIPQILPVLVEVSGWSCTAFTILSGRFVGGTASCTP